MLHSGLNVIFKKRFLLKKLSLSCWAGFGPEVDGIGREKVDRSEGRGPTYRFDVQVIRILVTEYGLRVHGFKGTKD